MDSTYHVNVIKLKWEIIWTGWLPYVSKLPNLPGVRHFHVNRRVSWFNGLYTNTLKQ